MRISLNGFVLTDKDKQLIVRGSSTKRIALSSGDTKQCPSFFAYRKTAERVIKTARFAYTRSALAYCRLFRLPTDDLSKLLCVTPCTITVEF